MSIAIRCVSVFLITALLPGPDAFAVAAAREKKTPPAMAHSPLNSQERTLHLLNRLSFGPRPGDVERVDAIGIQAWIEQQLHPESIDDSALEGRLAAYPAMRMSEHDLIEHFPAPSMIRAAENGKLSIPRGGIEHAIYADQIEQLRERQEKKADKQDSSAAPAQRNAQGGPMNTAPASAPPMVASEDRVYDDLNATRVTTLPPDQRVARLVSMQPEEFRSFLQHLDKPDRIALFNGLSAEQRETVFALLNPELVVGGEVLVTRMLRDIYSDRQLEAVMTDFWLNHFNVYLKKGPLAPWYLAEYQDRVIRPHALGKFEDLLKATAESPAMLFYLDNAESIGPHSVAAVRAASAPNGGKQRAAGLNENYARELMELHTLGVNGGYTQQDVTEVAKVFTGWTIDRPLQGGGFVFNDRRHEPGPKQVLHHTIYPNGQEEGLQVLHMLATSPATAHFVSLKLAQRFVSDQPPATLVNRMSAAWLKSGGDIREVLRAMFASPEFWSKDAYRAKVKTPEEYVISAVRASNADVVHPIALVEALNQLGMPFFGCQTPNGFSWSAEAWLNSGDLLDRMNFGLALAANKAGAAMPFDTLVGLGNVPAATVDQKEARLEDVLMNHTVSAHTHEAALAQASQQTPDLPQVQKQATALTFLKAREYGQILNAAPALPAPDDRQASLLAGLLLGSPDFQRR